MDQLNNYRPRRVWYCDKCEHYIYLNKKNGCPKCDSHIDGIRENIDYEMDDYDANAGGEWSHNDKKWSIYKMYGARSANQRQRALPEKQINHLRIACISDTHVHHRDVDVPECDILIHTGDVTNCGRISVLKDFDDWLGELIENNTTKIVLFVPGNHDISLHTEFCEDHWWRYFKEKREPYKLKNCTVLRDKSFEYEGLRVYGMPWCKKHNGWAFMSEKLKEKCDRIPNGTDILLTHNPPAGKRDCGYGIGELVNRIKQINPLVNVFGHVHSGYGIDKQSNKTTYINASMAGKGSAKICNAPIVFDLIKSE